MTFRFLLLLSTSILSISDAQLSIIFNRGNVDNNLAVFIGLLNGTTPEAAGLLDSFEGTAFLPIDRSFRQLSRQQPTIYGHVFDNEEFAMHLDQLLRHHLIPGPKRQSVDFIVGNKWQALSGETVQAAEVLPLTRGDINSQLVMGHKVPAVLLPSFWSRSVEDIVGAVFTGEDDDEVFTVYAPAEFDSACPAFLQAHVIMGRVDVEPTSSVVVEETLLANNGVVHRISQPLAYTACVDTTTEGSTGEQGEETEGGSNENSSTEVDGGNTEQVDNGSTGQTGGGDTQNETQNPTEETENPQKEGTPITTDISTEEESKFKELMPLIIGVSIGSCLVLVGACFGCLLISVCGSKGDYGRSDDSKKTPVTDQEIPDYVYEDPTFKDEDQGIMLDPEIQEPSFLTLPTFANLNEPDSNNNNNDDPLRL